MYVSYFLIKLEVKKLKKMRLAKKAQKIFPFFLHPPPFFPAFLPPSFSPRLFPSFCSSQRSDLHCSLAVLLPSLLQSFLVSLMGISPSTFLACLILLWCLLLWDPDLLCSRQRLQKFKGPEEAGIFKDHQGGQCGFLEVRREKSSRRWGLRCIWSPCKEN